MKQFTKEWGPFILFLIALGLVRLFLIQPVSVDGHSMDPTLADGERLIVLRTAKIDRFDIVVAKEKEGNKTKEIVKRVIGLPGDTITYKDDVLYVNGKKTSEPYLDKYQKAFEDDNLQDIYSYNTLFQQLAENSDAFTTAKDGSTEFTIKVPKISISCLEMTASFQKTAVKLVPSKISYHRRSQIPLLATLKNWRRQLNSTKT